MNETGIYLVAPDGLVVAELCYDVSLRAKKRWYRPWYPFAGPSRPQNRGQNPNLPLQHPCLQRGGFCEVCG